MRASRVGPRQTASPCSRVTEKMCAFPPIASALSPPACPCCWRERRVPCVHRYPTDAGRPEHDEGDECIEYDFYGWYLECILHALFNRAEREGRSEEEQHCRVSTGVLMRAHRGD